MPFQKGNKLAAKTEWSCLGCDHEWTDVESAVYCKCPECGSYSIDAIHNYKQSYRIRGVRFSADDPTGYELNSLLIEKDWSLAKFLAVIMDLVRSEEIIL